MNRTRRQVLASCGFLGATATLGGCIGTFGGSGSSGDNQGLFDRAPFYAWLPAPDALGADHLAFRTYSARAARERSDSLSDRMAQRFRQSPARNQPRPLEVDAENLDFVTSFAAADPPENPGRSGWIVVGSFGAGTVQSTLESNGFEAAESGGEYDHYRSTGPRARIVGVADGVAIITNTRGWDDPGGVIETLAAAERGEQRRYVDSSDDFATLARALGTGFQVNGAVTPETEGQTAQNGMQQIPGQVAGGLRLGASEEGAAQFQLVVVFASAAEADVEAVRTYLQEMEAETMVPIRPDAPLSTDGRVVTATQTVPG